MLDAGTEPITRAGPPWLLLVTSTKRSATAPVRHVRTNSERTGTERIPEPHRIAIREPVAVQPTRQPDRVRLRELTGPTRVVPPPSRKPLRGFDLPAGARSRKVVPREKRPDARFCPSAVSLPQSGMPVERTAGGRALPEDDCAFRECTLELSPCSGLGAWPGQRAAPPRTARARSHVRGGSATEGRLTDGSLYLHG
jgi:hypothetical protein